MRHLLSPPNLLTCARILLTPYIVFTLVRGDCRQALWLSCLAGATDAGDGFLARRFNWVTRIGAYLDPVADKFLLTALYICFAIAGLVNQALVWLVVGRDVLILLMASAGLLFTERRDYPPTVWGKLCTGLQIGGAVVFLSACAYPGSVAPGFYSITEGTIAAATAWSGVHYVWRAMTWARFSGGDV
jgi:cardiolipin synthase (CMP-forming)